MSGPPNDTFMAGLDEAEKARNKFAVLGMRNSGLALLILLAAPCLPSLGQTTSAWNYSDQAALGRRPDGIQEPVLSPYGGNYQFTDDGFYQPAFLGEGGDDPRSLLSSFDSRYYLDLYDANAPLPGLAEGLEWKAGIGSRLGLSLMPSMRVRGADGAGLDPKFLAFQLGPLFVDQLVAGAGVLYSDFTGHTVDYNDQLLAKDGWASIVWLSARVTLSLTEHLRLAVRPMIYWLPQKNQIGYGLPPAMLGITPANLQPNSFASLTLEQDIDNWTVAASDYFGARYRSVSLLDERLGFSLANDLSPVDRVGRYYLGYLGGRGTETDFDYTELNRGDRDPFSTARFSFHNVIGASLSGQHANGIRSILFAGRSDGWSQDFIHQGSMMEAGLWLAQSGNDIEPYGGYTATTRNELESVYHTVIVGAKWQASPRLLGYVQGGYLWTQEMERDRATWLGEAGLHYEVGPYTQFGLQGGRRVTDFDRGNSFLEDFVEGRVAQLLGPATSLALVAGSAKRRALDAIDSQAQNVDYVGMLFSHSLSDSRALVTIFAGYEDILTERSHRDFTRLTLRTNLWLPLSDSMFINAFYQFQEGDGSDGRDEYQEHLLFGGVTKRF